MKILITGVSGFAGKHLYNRLNTSGYDVTGIDMSGSFSDRIIRTDITDPAAVYEVFRIIKPDFVFHLAAISKVDFKNISDIYRINITGTINIFNACLSLEVPPRILFTSTSQVYGRAENDGTPIDEKFPVKPVNHYGAGKAAVENIARAYTEENGLPVVIARPFNHTGVNQDKHFVIPKLVEAYKQNSELELGDITTVRDFSDVRDVVEAYIGIMNHFKPGEVYNIASSKGYRIKEIISLLDELAGTPLKYKINSLFIRGNEIPVVIGNSDKLKADTGWKPVYGITDTLRWMLQN